MPREQIAKATTCKLITGDASVDLLASQSVRWRLQAGVEPVIEEFSIRPQDKVILEAGIRGMRAGLPGGFVPGGTRGVGRMKSIKLQIESVAGHREPKKISFDKLYVVDFLPGPNKHMLTVRVADRRYWWQYGWCLRRFNMTMRTGTKRVMDDGNDLRPTLDHHGYRDFSLNNGEIWSHDEIVDAVYQDCMLPEGENLGGRAIPDIRRAPSFQQFAGGDAADITSDNIEFDDRADQALARAISQVPGMQVFVDAVGNVVLYNDHDEGEKFDVPPAHNMMEIENSGHLDFVKNNMTRPSSVRVNFTYEAEVKFSFRGIGPPSASTAIITPNAKLEGLIVDNVLPLPDHKLDIEDGGEGGGRREVATGTWVEINNDLFKAWGAVRGLGGGRALQLGPRADRMNYPGLLSFTHILRGAVPFMDAWGFVALSGAAIPEVDWMGRISSIAGHWRRTFRLPQLFLHRIIDVKPWRACMLDPVTGARAKASVYADYSIVPNQRIFMHDPGCDLFLMNVKGYDDRVDVNKSSGIPAMVSISDGEQGIFSVEYLPDPGRLYSQFIPGTMNRDNNPTNDIKHGGRHIRPITWDAARSGGGLPQLEADWKALFVMTCIPGAPNNMGQCFVHEVKFEDIHTKLPVAAKEGGFDAQGPAMEIHVPASVATARVAWTEEGFIDTKQIFGIGVAENLSPMDALNHRMSLSRRLQNRVVNFGDGRFDKTGEDLKAVAEAYALQTWTEYVDRIEGRASSDLQTPVSVGLAPDDPTRVGPAPMMRDGVGPRGHLSTVSFEVSPDGRATSSFSLPEKIPAYQFFSFLDSGTRAVVLGLASVGLKK